MWSTSVPGLKVFWSSETLPKAPWSKKVSCCMSSTGHRLKRPSKTPKPNLPAAGPIWLMPAKNLKRSQDLIKSGAISQSDLDLKTSTEAQAMAAVESAQAGLESAKLNLSYTRISGAIHGADRQVNLQCG